MLKLIKRLFQLVILGLVAAFLHYNLPDRDIVKVVGTDVKRMDIKKGAWGWGRPDAGTGQFDTRDVRFIYTVRPNNKEMVYRNEDTDWGWPPYFKFDTGNLAAQAQALEKDDEEVWVAVRHYGWRIPLWSIYPNAVSIKRVDGPNAVLIPWFNIAFLIMLLALFLYIWSKIRAFRKKRIDPVTEKISDTAEAVTDAVGDEIKETKDAAGGFFKRWFGTSE